MEQNEAFMASPIGDLPINSEGLRKAIDEIVRLQKVEVKFQELCNPVGNTYDLISAFNYNRLISDDLHLSQEMCNKLRAALHQVKIENKKLKQIVDYKLSYNKKVKIEAKDIIDGLNKQELKVFIKELKSDIHQAAELEPDTKVILVEDVDIILKEHV